MRIYRASSLGGCLKAQVAEQLGYDRIDRPEQTQLLFAEGDLHEDAVKKQLREDGYEIDWEQKTVNLIISKDVVLQGHLDGRIVFPEKPPWTPYPMVLEIKSMSDEPWKRFNSKKWAAGGLIDKYKWQLSAYMLATGLPGFFYAKNRNNGRFVMEVVKKPFYTLDEVKERVLEIDRWVVRDELPLECSPSEQYPCPFYYLHGGKPGADSTTNDDDTDDPTLREAALHALHTGQLVKEAEAENKKARQTLRELLGERKRLNLDDVTVSVSERRITTLDREKMVADGIEPTDYERIEFREVMTVKKGKGAATQGEAESGTNPDDGKLGNRQNEGVD